MRRALIAVGATICLVVGLAVAPTPAPSARAWGTPQQFRVWIFPAETVAYNYNSGCTVTSRIVTQEFGRQGVTGFKVRWELRGVNDPGFLPSYRKLTYDRSPRFLNDTNSYWWGHALTAGRINFAPDREFALWVKVVGVRAGRPDFTRHIRLGTVACSSWVEPDPYTYDDDTNYDTNDGGGFIGGEFGM